MSTLFSVVLITHDQKAYAASALRSIIEAVDDDAEIVCVDDGSSDGTAELLEECARHDPRVKVIRRKHSGKPSVLRNAGISAATGRWVSFLDGDDLYDGRRFSALRTVITCAAHAPDVIIHDHVVFIDPEPVQSGSSRITPALQERMLRTAGDGETEPSPDSGAFILDGDQLAVFLLAETFLLHTSSFCARRDMLVRRNIRFDETRLFGEDHPFILECVVGSRVAFVPQTLSYYRRHDRSLTTVRTSSAQAELIQSMHEQLQLLERRAPHALQSVSRLAIRGHLLGETLHLGYLLEQAGHTRRAVAIYLRATTRFKASIGWLRAAKALIRKAT